MCLLSEQFLPSPFREFVHDGYCLDHGSSGSRTKEMLAVRKLSLWYKIPIWLQNTACPKTYRRLSKNKSLSLQQVFTLASVTSCVNIREFLKDATTADSHENVARKSEFTFFQSLSWLFQLDYFVKCKRTPLELNFYQPYPRSWREWILSLLVYVLHKTWNKAFSRVVRVLVQLTAKKCTKKRSARAKLLFCLHVKLLLIWLSRRRCILNFLLFTIHCDPSKTEYSRGKLNCSCW